MKSKSQPVSSELPLPKNKFEQTVRDDILLFEERYSKEIGKRYRLQYTRQSICGRVDRKAKGYIGTIEDTVKGHGKGNMENFYRAEGLGVATFEQRVVENPGLFSADAVLCAKARLR